MTEKFIPEHIDPYRFAEQKMHLEGVLNIKDMPRLCESLRAPEGKVSVDIVFQVDEQETPLLKGHLHTHIQLECQRCLESFPYEITCDFVLGIVSSDEDASMLAECYEPLLVKSHSLAVREMIEDELILNLPLIPKHEPEACKVQITLQGKVGEEEVIKKNPFQVLESLKDKHS